MLNTIRQAQATSGVQKVHAVIGGFHIVPPLTEEYMREVVGELKKIDPDYVMPAHCSGEQFYDIARSALPNKVIHTESVQGSSSQPDHHECLFLAHCCPVPKRRHVRSWRKET